MAPQCSQNQVLTSDLGLLVHLTWCLWSPQAFLSACPFSSSKPLVENSPLELPLTSTSTSEDSLVPVALILFLPISQLSIDLLLSFH